MRRRKILSTQFLISLLLFVVCFIAANKLLECVRLLAKENTADRRPDAPRVIYHFFEKGSRLGNMMFQYASILGLAYTFNRTAVFKNSQDFNGLLKTPIVGTTRQPVEAARPSRRKLRETACCRFDERLTYLDPKLDYIIEGFLLSWKYFIKHEERIKKALTFSDSIRNESAIIVHQIRKNFSGSTLVGVHVRKWNLTRVDIMKMGYTSASPEYLNKSLSYFQVRYPDPVFVIASDDINWCKSNFPERFKTIYLNNNAPAVDMSILSQLDHMVTTTGTFSWWCGYFNPGTVVYPKNFVVPNSWLELQFLLGGSDYFYPGWIPL